MTVRIGFPCWNHVNRCLVILMEGRDSVGELGLGY